MISQQRWNCVSDLLLDRDVTTVKHEVIWERLQACGFSLGEDPVLATLVIVVKMTAIPWTVEIGINRVGRAIGMESSIVSRTTSAASGIAGTDRFDSPRKNGFRDVLPIPARRDANRRLHIESAQSGRVMIRNNARVIQSASPSVTFFHSC